MCGDNCSQSLIFECYSRALTSMDLCNATTKLRVINGSLPALPMARGSRQVVPLAL